jgi:hypothetical protein
LAIWQNRKIALGNLAKKQNRVENSDMVMFDSELGNVNFAIWQSGIDK